MARTSSEIATEIRRFQPQEGDWRPLDDLLAELWATDNAADHIADMLSLFERYPEEDGAGVLWSVVHGVESLPGYEPEVVLSLRRQPSELALTMVRRLLNSGVMEIGGISLVGLLRDVASSAAAPKRVQSAAANWIERHA